MLRRILVLVLVLGFMPVTELVERFFGAAEHTVHADGLASEEHSRPSPEHGCAALFHTCGCSAAHVADVVSEPRTSRLALYQSAGVAGFARLAGRLADAPPVPPPNA